MHMSRGNIRYLEQCTHTHTHAQRKLARAISTKEHTKTIIIVMPTLFQTYICTSANIDKNQ